MKNLFLLFLLLFISGCSNAQIQDAFKLEKVVLDDYDENYGYYYQVKPKGKVKSALVLLPGFGQKSESIFHDTRFHEIAFDKNMLVIGFAGRVKLAADSLLLEKLNQTLNHVQEEFKLDKDKFVMGGFSAGGSIALRYTELCHQYPDKYPIKPRAVFMADSPVDLFFSWKLQEENMKNNYSQISVDEAKWIQKFYRDFYGGTPKEKPEIFAELTPFSIDKQYGNNEQYLKDVAVRAYHDVDIAWRLKNRNQTARYDNYIATSELINRLMLMGNNEAEFIQTFQTGYRKNGERHPHSWSIIDEAECIEWIESLMN